MLESRKTVRILVRFALKRKIIVKRKHLNRSRARAFRKKSRKTDKKVRYGTDTVGG
jgi:hypothetical protein